MKDRFVPFVGSVLLHFGLISGLILSNLNHNNFLQTKATIIPISFIELKQNISSPVETSLKKASPSVEEKFFSKDIFSEKLVFPERRLKNNNKERITHLQEAKMVRMNLPLPEFPKTPFAESTFFTREQKGRIKNLFLAKIKERIEEVKRYPRRAKDSGIEGKAIIRFKLSCDGKAGSIFLISSSRYPLLDAEAKDTIKRASPFPPIPDALKEKDIEITVPITFRLKEKIDKD